MVYGVTLCMPPATKVRILCPWALAGRHIDTPRLLPVAGSGAHLGLTIWYVGKSTRQQLDWVR